MNKLESIFSLMKKTAICLFLFSTILRSSILAQGVAINEDDSDPDASAMLDVKSNDKGVLIPRMTQAQRIAIASPATGLLVYQTDGVEGFWFRESGGWVSLSGGATLPISASDISGGTLVNSVLDADLQDLADGSLSGNVVGSGISASNITAGTLSVNRYDAYNDLEVSGRLDNTAGTDLLTRSQTDSRYINEGDIISVESGDYLEFAGGALDYRFRYVNSTGQSFSLESFNTSTSATTTILRLSDPLLGPPALIPGSNGGAELGNSFTRWSTVYAVNGTINTSDLRLKKNVVDINYGLEHILKLRPVNYEWKDNSSGVKLGMIAQEVSKIIPEVVHIGKDIDHTYGINYSELIPVLVKAIQEQQIIIEDLKNEVSALRSAQERLENKLNVLLHNHEEKRKNVSNSYQSKDLSLDVIRKD